MLSECYLPNAICLRAVNGGSAVTLDDVIKPTASVTDVEDQLIMETKLTIIEILKVCVSFASYVLQHRLFAENETTMIQASVQQHIVIL